MGERSKVLDLLFHPFDKIITSGFPRNITFNISEAAPHPIGGFSGPFNGCDSQENLVDALS